MKDCWFRLISVAALVFSAAACSFVMFSVESKEVDWANTFVGILSFITTVLIGWQIWNVVSLEKRIEKKITDASEDLRKEIDGKVNDAERELSGLSYVSTSRIYVNAQKTDCHNYMWALFHLLGAIENYSRVNNKNENLITNINITLCESLDAIKNTPDEDKQKFFFDFIVKNPGIEKKWLDALHKIWAEEKIDKKSVETLIEFLQKV